LSFIKIIKSLFKNQEQLRTPSREEDIRNQENMQETTRDFDPPTYIYKTAKAKAAEPILLEERNWILRFQNQECPYCHHIFEQIKGNRKCPECKNKVIVRSHYQTKEKCLLTEEEADLFDKKKEHYFNERWCIRETSMFDVSEEEFYKQWNKMGKAYSGFDVMWHYINKYRIKYAQEGNWGLYRNTFVHQAQNLKRRGNEDESYSCYLYLAYLDANGPSNSARISGKPFDIKFAFQAPHTLSMLSHFQEKNNISNDQLKSDFLDVAEKDSIKSIMPLTSEQSWNSFYIEYKKYFKGK
jgi:predicted Zn-ribbon and HTH transcriptional regulator